MNNFLENVVMRGFWNDWIERFKYNAGDYITPDNERVISAVDEVDVSGADSDVEKAHRVWGFITHEIEYKLSKEWKEPEETLRDKIGDCEDMDFLAISMLENMGIDDANLVVGNLSKPSGGGGAHAWVSVDGAVIDPTGRPETVKDLEYQEVHTFQIETVVANGS